MLILFLVIKSAVVAGRAPVTGVAKYVPQEKKTFFLVCLPYEHC